MVLEHGISLDGEDAMHFNFIDDMNPRRLYQFLCRLARTKHGGEACENGADQKKKEECASVKIVEKGKKNGVVNRSCEEDAKNKDILKEEASEAIARFFYDNAILPKMVESKEFIAMCGMISRLGVGYEPPSSIEISEKCLAKAKSADKALEEHRAVWKTRGCTIMVDAWIDKNKRSILNLFANSIKGTYFLKSVDATDMLESETPFKLFKMMDDIVEEVGEENVAQIVTDNTPFYKAAGEMLMEKRTRLYWTPCVTHCIEMILEEYEKKIPIYEKTIAKGKRITNFIYSRNSMVSLLHRFTKGMDLVKPSITRCATSYLTLDCLYENKVALRKMFISKEWRSSQFAKTSVGKSVEDVVFDKEFWKNILMCLKGAGPLIEVLRSVNSIDEPATGFIYEAMEQAKEEIRSNLSIESFIPLRKIIYERWDKQRLNPLHVAAYFLNPQYHYCIGLRDDDNIIARGLHQCITRMVGSPEERAKIEIQLDDFEKRANLLGDPLAVMRASYETPSVWWTDFGGGLPELQSLAIRVLSLTCSSYGSEINQSAFKMVCAKRRNLLSQEAGNSKLGEKRQGRGSVELNLNDDGDIEGLDADDLGYDMISDLHGEYANGDEDQTGPYWR
ncbi:uncharacterized protein LOC131644443 isoform X2 [Vicia villosa]|uniref:uncharacterized protein LOC131644443 isoform X2 n=1 Tax=Vicia villosa TaxID=3911 RepID=UPI00273BB96F|nr:uncharacterized protein LOC131644443 isoform X2 [Vicia villosa]